MSALLPFVDISARVTFDRALSAVHPDMAILL